MEVRKEVEGEVSFEVLVVRGLVELVNLRDEVVLVSLREEVVLVNLTEELVDGKTATVLVLIDEVALVEEDVLTEELDTMG